MNSFFLRLKNIFKNFFKSSADKEILSGLDIDIDKINEDPSIVEQLQEIYQLNSNIIDEINIDLPKLRQEYSSIQRIQKLSKKTKDELAALAKLYSEMVLERLDFKKKVKFNSSEDSLNSYSKDIEEALETMRQTEENQQLVKMDLAYLEGERDDLIYERNKLFRTDKLINKVFFVISVISLILVLIVVVNFSDSQLDIVVASGGAMVVIVLTTIWSYFTRRAINRGLKKNKKSLSKVIGLINKTKIKFINNKKLLDYQCKKYKVDSYYTFTVRLKNYKENQNNINKYKKINNSISVIVEDIERLLRKISIEDDRFVFDNIDYFTSEDDRNKLLGKYEDLINEMENKLKKYEKENSVIYIVLSNYKSANPTNSQLEIGR